jgi:cytochrome c
MSRSSIAFATALALSALLPAQMARAADQFASPDQAKALFDRAIAALKANEATALKTFNDEKDKQFRDRDLYVYCFNVGDGKFTAFQNNMMVGVDVRELKIPPDDPIGQRAYDAVHDAPEGNIVTVEYNFPKPGTKEPAIKQSLEARIGTQACGVTYFK